MSADGWLEFKMGLFSVLAGAVYYDNEWPLFSIGWGQKEAGRPARLLPRDHVAEGHISILPSGADRLDRPFVHAAAGTDPLINCVMLPAGGK
jgi:hypothetical protein